MKCARDKNIYDDTTCDLLEPAAMCLRVLKKYIEARRREKAKTLIAHHMCDVNLIAFANVSERRKLGEKREAILP